MHLSPCATVLTTGLVGDVFFDIENHKNVIGLFFGGALIWLPDDQGH
jgi:hypothetical protein